MGAAALAAAPSYVLFALCLMPTSAWTMRLLRWRTQPDATMAIAACDWPLLAWARAMVAAHVVRLVSGTIFKGSPLWTFYLRLNGARLGRRVYVNSLSVSDHNLLEFGDNVVIGAEAHISGHTVEGGFVKTGRVRIGSSVTIGLGTVIDIGVTIGSNCQIGALSLVPKHTTLAGDAVYAGVPAHRLK
jgi:non-ribosomal peptide synthetase-like protein